jgi:hypothetical protein
MCSSAVQCSFSGTCLIVDNLYHTLISMNSIAVPLIQRFSVGYELVEVYFGIMFVFGQSHVYMYDINMEIHI